MALLRSVELRMHRAAWCILAAFLALAACGGAHVESARPIDFITPTPTRGPLRVPVASDGVPPTWTPTVIAETPTIAKQATPVPAHSAGGFTTGVEQWRPLVASVFPAWAVETVLCLIRWESGGDPNAVSPTNDHGLLQLNAINLWMLGGASPYDPEANLRVAYRLYVAAGGWWPWAARARCGV